jgi:hypothetical protein
MPMIYVVPAAGGRVRQPERAFRVMPAAGAFVPRDAHYERLIQSGDVIVTDPPKKATPPAEAGKSTSTRNTSKSDA